MKKVFIKYNPYKLETEITVDGKELAYNSKIAEKISPGSRLQEWVEELPSLLIDEYNDIDFDITFHGTIPDFEDLTEVLNLAYENDKLIATLNRKPAKETADKEKLIDTVFKKIQDGPFNELKSSDIINAFEHVKSSDFEVCVVATMSAGKSTLINALLEKNLMPSKQEACTAIITRIKDSTKEGNSWKAKIYDKTDKEISTDNDLTYDAMNRLNSDEKVSRIEVEGNIPFVSAKDISLILIDTPGPNNSRDPEHKKVQSEFLSESSKALVLYIMEGTFGSDDDNSLLQRVADSMNVGGKQSKDRFIFVVNKMDNRRKEDGDTKDTLKRIEGYLKKHGIDNPNLFPVAALPALNIRLISKKEEVDEDTLDETYTKVRKLNRNESLHLESYAALPTSIRNDINRQLLEAKSEGNIYKEALIHTGIVSVEAAIRQYVEKYAKTAKIKNLVDTFMHKLDEVGCFEKTKQELASNVDENKRILEHISNIKKKMDDINSVKKFKDNVDSAVNDINNKSKEVIESIIEKYQALIRERIDNARGKVIYSGGIESELTKLESFAKELEPNIYTELNDLIRENLIKTCNILLEEYKNKLSSLTEQIDIEGINTIKIDPLGLMKSSVIPATDFSVKNITHTKEIDNGGEWVKNTNRKWFKPWTLFQEKGYYRNKYKTVKYVNASELAQEYLSGVQEAVYANNVSVYAYVLNQSNKIINSFDEEFNHLDSVLKEKLSELENFATDKKRATERIKESQRKLKWLKKIKQDVESILKI